MAQASVPRDPHAWLADLPTAVLVAELNRRHPAPPPDVLLPGLVVRTSRSQAVWRGRSVRLTGRENQLLTALAQDYPRGSTTVDLARRIWGCADTSERKCVMVYVCYLRQKLPGLIVGNRPSRAEGNRYWLALAEGDR